MKKMGLKELIKIENNKGLKQDPCGPPYENAATSDQNFQLWPKVMWATPRQGWSSPLCGLTDELVSVVSMAIELKSSKTTTEQSLHL